MIEYNKKTEQFKSITGTMVSTYQKKNKDYGNSFSRMCGEYGMTYPVIHLDEKLARVKSILLSNGGSNAVKGESARDSLIDLACYAVMTIMEIDAESSAAMSDE